MVLKDIFIISFSGLLLFVCGVTLYFAAKIIGFGVKVAIFIENLF